VGHQRGIGEGIWVEVGRTVGRGTLVSVPLVSVPLGVGVLGRVAVAVAVAVWLGTAVWVLGGTESVGCAVVVSVGGAGTVVSVDTGGGAVVGATVSVDGSCASWTVTSATTASCGGGVGVGVGAGGSVTVGCAEPITMTLPSASTVVVTLGDGVAPVAPGAGRGALGSCCAAVGTAVLDFW